MKCNSCRTENDSNAIICQNCQRPLKRSGTGSIEGKTPSGPLLSNPARYSVPKRAFPLSTKILLSFVIIIILLSSWIFYIANNTSIFKCGSLAGRPCSSPTPEKVKDIFKITNVNGNNRIGMSDGKESFDIYRENGQVKSDAGDYWQKHKEDFEETIKRYDQAINQNSDDAEAHIYRENLDILRAGEPYITVIAGIVFTREDPAPGRETLQGIYVAQKEFNDGAKLKGKKVRVLIANSGDNSANATEIAQNIVKLAKQDKTFVGVVGWPYSTHTERALEVFKSYKIPMISSIASSDDLTGASKFFFRVAPPDKEQGAAAAKYARTLDLHTVAIFRDLKDTYSKSLASAFEASFEAIGGKIVIREDYTANKQDTIADSVNGALSEKPDFIYFAGYAPDASALLANLPPSNPLVVMGGDSLYALGQYKQFAKAAFDRLRITTFAHPDQWEVMKLASRKPSFFEEYAAAFDPDGKHKGSYGFDRADYVTIMAYDATLALLQGCKNVLSSQNTTLTPERVRDGIAQIDKMHPLAGASGQIVFADTGDPVNKTIVFIRVVSKGIFRMENFIDGTM